MGGGLTIEEAPPVAVMLQPSFTHTARNQDTPPAPGTSTNNDTVLEDSSLFYGGQIYGNLGALIQGTHDRATEHTFLDNSDVRYADTASMLGLDFIYGVDVNNNPSVQDVWNTTPAWSFPYIASSLAPQFAPPGTLIEGGLAGQSRRNWSLHLLERHAVPRGQRLSKSIHAGVAGARRGRHQRSLNRRCRALLARRFRI